MKIANRYRPLIFGFCSSLIWAAPAEARFLQVDPVGYQDQFNLYTYVGNDPVDGRDPTGQDRVVCTVVDRSASCSITFDDRNTTTVTYNITRHFTDPYGREHTSTSSINRTYQGSISQEGLLSRLVLGTGAQILRSIEGNLNTLTGTTGGRLVPGSGESSASARSGDPQSPTIAGSGGRPSSNTAQIRQVRDAARDEGLNDTQRRQLGREVEYESRRHGANLGYHEIREIARSIRAGNY
jgi:hypothetical protein